MCLVFVHTSTVPMEARGRHGIPRGWSYKQLMSCLMWAPEPTHRTSATALCAFNCCGAPPPPPPPGEGKRRGWLMDRDKEMEY